MRNLLALSRMHARATTLNTTFYAIRVAALVLATSFGCGDSAEPLDFLRADYEGDGICQGTRGMGVITYSANLSHSSGMITFTLRDDAGEVLGMRTSGLRSEGRISFFATCPADASEIVFQLSADATGEVARFPTANVRIPCVPCDADGGRDAGPDAPDGGPGDTGTPGDMGVDSGVELQGLDDPAAVVQHGDDDSIGILDTANEVYYSCRLPTDDEPVCTPMVVSGALDAADPEGEIEGEGPEFDEATDAARVDEDNTLVINAGNSTLLNVHHPDAARTVVAGPGMGSSPPLDGAHSVVYEPSAERACVGLSPFGGTSSVVCIDTNTSEGEEVWRAPERTLCTGLALRAATNELLMFCGNDLIAFSLDTSEERTLGDFESGPGLPLYVACQVDDAQDRLFMVSTEVAAVSIFDFETSEVTVLSGPEDGEGPAFIALKDVLYLPPPIDRLFVVDSANDTLMEIIDGADRIHRTMLDE